MDLYFKTVLILLAIQVLFTMHIVKNYRYALNKYIRDRIYYRPKTALIVPCKGLDSSFEKNITSFFRQDYKEYILWFVVEDNSDEAYEKLVELKRKLASDSTASEVTIQIAGKSNRCSQKIHNLLYCYENLPDDIEVMAFADSDICIRDNWLSHIVYPLSKDKYGSAGGYRWFVPKKNNIASLALSATNAKVAQLLGNTIFNQLWGGSMAIKVEKFREFGIDKLWKKSLSDDLSMSYAVKKAHYKIAFVPVCLVASYEQTTWRGLFEFGRRQFLITRIASFGTWLFGLCSSIFAVAGLWGMVFMAVYAAVKGLDNLYLFIGAPILFFTIQLIRAIMRQHMISKLLKDDVPKMKAAMIADMCFFWVWSILILIFIVISAFGRKITWRTIKYKMISPTETVVID